MATSGRAIRSFRADDEPAVAALWHRSGRAAYTFLPTWQTFTLPHATQVFHDMIVSRCDIWVGTVDQRVVSDLAMSGTYIDGLYVDPAEWRQGWGAQLVAFAKGRSPRGLELHTHQENREIADLMVAESVSVPSAKRSSIGGWRSPNLAGRREACFRKLRQGIVTRVREAPPR